MIRKAACRGAEFILLPEGFTRTVQEIPGESLNPLRTLARECRIFILAGSVYEKVKGSAKVYNTSVLIDSRGLIKARYRKIHLFEAVIGIKRVKESSGFLAGKKPVAVEVGPFKAGLSICYDVRFPQMYRRYACEGAHILCVPSAFTRSTGKAHWEILLRARAVENQCYVLAPNLAGVNAEGVPLYGHSMIIDPWGRVLAAADGTGEGMIFADVDMKTLRARRRMLPRIRKEEFL